MIVKSPDHRQKAKKYGNEGTVWEEAPCTVETTFAQVSRRRGSERDTGKSGQGGFERTEAYHMPYTGRTADSVLERPREQEWKGSWR